MTRTTGSAEVYDPSTPEFQQHIWDVYRVMRDEHPVYHDPEADFYALTRFEDVWAAAGDHTTFSSQVREADDLLPQLIYMDPPRQTALRRLVSRAFTPRRVAGMEGRIRANVRALVAAVRAAHGADGVCEFQHEYAAVVPSVVVAGMIGLDEHLVAPMRGWTEQFVGIRATGDFGQAANHIYAAFAELLAQRRRHPREDLMTALLDAEVDGSRLTDDELLGFCMLLVLGGNDTTASLIGSGTMMLLEHPEQRDMLLGDPALWPQAVEECNRYESPTQALPRTTTREVGLHGVRIPAGSRVMLVWGAANHDEREFPDPERFDITRPIPRHLSFGHGVHFCMGAGLARLEARIAFQEWFAQLPNCRLEGEPRRTTSLWARAYDYIPLRLGPANGAATPQS